MLLSIGLILSCGSHFYSGTLGRHLNIKSRQIYRIEKYVLVDTAYCIQNTILCITKKNNNSV